MSRGETSNIVVRLQMINCLKDVFKKNTRNNALDAWNSLTSKKGEIEVKKLINNPSRSLSVFKTLNFKEWLSNQS